MYYYILPTIGLLVICSATVAAANQTKTLEEALGQPKELQEFISASHMADDFGQGANVGPSNFLPLLAKSLLAGNRETQGSRFTRADSNRNYHHTNTISRSSMERQHLSKNFPPKASSNIPQFAEFSSLSENFPFQAMPMGF